MEKTCKKCGKLKEVSASGKTEGLCHICYKRLIWKPKLIKCQRCDRELPMHARGFCAGCYNSVFHLEKVRMQNAVKRHNIKPELYKVLTEKCAICGFDKIVELHHLDHNRFNPSSDNLAGLCPNHHKMLHSKKYQQEIFATLREKGFKVPKSNLSDGFFKKSF
jgi:ribosomal protein L37E